MQLWKTILTYDGTPFCGWQVQPGLETVQGTLARAILRVTGESVLPQGSGRTDAGVHALAQVATFAIAAPIPAENLLRALNRALPGSVRILSAEPVAAGFHARHSARRKTYEYRIFLRSGMRDFKDGMRGERICSPMIASFVWDCPWLLEGTRMREAARYVLGEHDFTSFAASDPDLAARSAEVAERASGVRTGGRTGVRTIYRSEWMERDGLLCYRVTGSGFLHHMVRNLVGTFVDVGAGRVEADAIPAILAARNRSAAGPTAPARGVFLVEVEY